MNKITLLSCLVNNSLGNTLPIYVEIGFPVALVVLDLDGLDLWSLLSAGYHAWRYMAVGIKPRASCKLGKYSLNWATPRVFKLRCFLKIGLCYSPWSALELAILLSQPEWWNNWCAPPCLWWTASFWVWSFLPCLNFLHICIHLSARLKDSFPGKSLKGSSQRRRHIWPSDE